MSRSVTQLLGHTFKCIELFLPYPLHTPAGWNTDVLAGAEAAPGTGRQQGRFAGKWVGGKYGAIMPVLICLSLDLVHIRDRNVYDIEIS